jgi:hypothetical protein
VVLIDSMPIPLCKRARAWRWRQVRGRDSCGSCAAKQAACCGGRRHPVRTPGGLHDPTPIHARTYGRPAGATGYGDTGDTAGPDEAAILADTGVRRVPLRTATMRPSRWADKRARREYRQRIETPDRQCAALGLERPRARTNPGRALTVHAAVLAATRTNAD